MSKAEIKALIDAGEELVALLTFYYPAADLNCYREIDAWNEAADNAREAEGL